MPFAVTVQDRCMYSHTFTFGDGVPFTTGCTSVVSVTIEGPSLGPFDVLIDICVAQQLLRAACAEYDHKNLDTLAEFKRPDGTLLNTTVEVVARAIHRRMFDGLKAHHREHAAPDGKGPGTTPPLPGTPEVRAAAPAATAAPAPNPRPPRAGERRGERELLGDRRQRALLTRSQLSDAIGRVILMRGARPSAHII